MYEFINKFGLKNLLIQMQVFFGLRKPFDIATIARNQYLLNIDYENTLAFDTSFIVGDNNPYVGYAIVGSTYVA